MIQCPECREMLPEDSAFCDKCGKELKWCPKCRRPKRGMECPVCGNDLIAGRKYQAMLASGESLQPVQQTDQPQSASHSIPESTSQPVVRPVTQTVAEPQRTAVASPQPTALVGNGWRLTLREGAFGRVGGLWPELSTCTYVSSNHGVIGRTAAGWTITDNGTTNGTYVNGQRLQAGSPAVLTRGSSVRIATLEFVVE